MKKNKVYLILTILLLFITASKILEKQSFNSSLTIESHCINKQNMNNTMTRLGTFSRIYKFPKNLWYLSLLNKNFKNDIERQTLINQTISIGRVAKTKNNMNLCLNNDTYNIKCHDFIGSWEEILEKGGLYYQYLVEIDKYKTIKSCKELWKYKPKTSTTAGNGISCMMESQCNRIIEHYLVKRNKNKLSRLEQ